MDTVVRRGFVLLFSAIAAFSLSIPAAATEPVVFEGSGWGHGVGMSQYGSRAMARSGYDYRSIVEYYFTGATVAPYQSKVPSWVDGMPLWVHLHTANPKLEIRATGAGLYVCQQEPESVASLYLSKNSSAYSDYVLLLEQRLTELGYNPGAVDGWYTTQTDAAVRAFQTDRGLEVDGIVGTDTKNALWNWDGADRCVIRTPLPTTTITITRTAEGCTVQGSDVVGSCIGSVRNPSPSSRVLLPQRTARIAGVSQFMEIGHGQFRIRPGSGMGIHAVAQLSVEDYVLGIHETILAWGTGGAMDALYAQAVVSRSYGLGRGIPKGPESGFGSDRRNDCWCHLRSTSSDQVYGGWHAEVTYNALWREAVNHTTGLIVTHPQEPVVTAYFGSSSGGKTDTNVWAGWSSTQLPYLQSVDDHWSLHTLAGNPNASWTVELAPSVVASKLGFDGLTGVKVLEKNPSGTVKTVRFSGTKNGDAVTSDKTGAWVTSQFGLKSRYFDLEWGQADAGSGGGGGSTPPAASPGDSYPFSDIANNRFASDILWLYERDLTRGCNPPANDRFCPDSTVSRGEMAVFLERALKLTKASGDYFDDDNGKFYEAAANSLYEAGITSGCGTRKFCGGDSIPREQMAAFLARALKLEPAPRDFFVDDAKSMFQDEINRVAHADVTRGCNPPTNDRFCPKEFVTRGQLAAFLKRALD